MTWPVIIKDGPDQKFQEEVVTSYNTMYNNYNENSHNNHTG